MRKIRVFVSSSLTEVENEREIAQESINQLNMEPVMFEELPAMDKTLENAYLDEIRKAHVFVAILWKDLSEAVEREYSTALELGVPMLLLVKMINYRESRTPRLERLLNGNIEANLLSQGLQSVPFRKKFRTLRELERELKDGLMNLVSDRFTEPALTATSNEVTSRIALKMIQSAKRRLLLVVRTPQILLGLRPYDSEHKNYLEESLYKAVTDWIDQMVKDERRRFLFLYSNEDAQNEIKKYGLCDVFKKNLEKYAEIMEKTNGRFEIASIQEYLGRILISDNSFGIQFRAPGDKVFCIFRQDASISTNLFDVFYEYRGSCEKTICDLRKELGFV